jgi:hypothetical protein
MRVVLIMVTFAVAIVVTAFITKTTYQAIEEQKKSFGDNGNGKPEAEENVSNEEN